MTQRKTLHHLIHITRDLAGFTPMAVYQAWANPAAKAAWFSGPPDWYAEPHQLDFRVGGKEVSIGGPKGGFVSKMEGTYIEIVPNERIIYAFTMTLDEVLITVSLATVEFKLIDTGTRLILNEQIVFLDGSDHVEGREHGTNAMIDLLEAYLKSSERGLNHDR